MADGLVAPDLPLHLLLAGIAAAPSLSCLPSSQCTAHLALGKFLLPTLISLAWNPDLLPALTSDNIVSSFYFGFLATWSLAVPDLG
jgi:hypothetical protein